MARLALQSISPDTVLLITSEQTVLVQRNYDPADQSLHG